MARILALVSFKIFPPHMGGQKGVALFYEHLNHHHEVRVLASSDNLEDIDAGYPVETILYPNKKMLRNLSLVTTIVKIIKKEKIDCLIAEHSYTGWMGYLLKKRTGIPFIIHSHNLEMYRFRQMNKKGWMFYSSYEKWIHQKADHNFFISREDMETATNLFSLEPKKCSVAPYGIKDPKQHLNPEEKLRSLYDLDQEYIFHFNGTMDYEPNIDAVNFLVDEVNPRLQKAGLDYVILITGKRLSSEIQEKIRNCMGIRYLDFIDDIDLMYQSSHLFLNTVVNDSGVKTKVIEALANHCTVVSSKPGAAGIPEDCFQGKMFLTSPLDWDAFCEDIIAHKDNRQKTPAAFFDYFSWERIAGKAAVSINETLHAGI